MRYQSSKARPYVYVCTHRITKQIYIGYREANVKLNRTSDADFVLYRTSCTSVKADFDNFDWEIVAEFSDGQAAYEFEQQLIYQYWNDPLLINRHCCYSGKHFRRAGPPWNKGKSLPYRTEETKNKIREKRALQIMQLSPFKGKTYENLYGPRSASLKEKVSLSMKAANIVRSDAFKDNLRRPKTEVICPHCGVHGGGGAMSRWHFDNCKAGK